MTPSDAPLWVPIAVSAAAVMVVAAAGGVMTDVGPWYQALKKPTWNPPNWLFGPIWTTIYILVAASAVIVWRSAQTEQDQIMILGLFAINAVLGIVWNLFFFKLKRPDWAMFEITLFWASIVTLIVFFWRISPLSSLLLVPYVTWVSIASFLNFTIVRMNNPFGLAT
jgi:translocator protein